MYQLIYHCFGKSEVLATFNKCPKQKQVQSATPSHIHLTDGKLDRFFTQQTVMLAFGE